MPKRFLILLSVLWLPSGCALSTPQLAKLPPVPESKLQPCPPLKMLAGGKHQQVEEWAVATVFAYRSCTDTHQDLIDAVRARQDTK